MNKSVEEFIGSSVVYDPHGQYIWGVNEKEELQMIADVRGWGAIQNLFKEKDGSIDFQAANEFQDKLGEFIAEAINKHLQVLAFIKDE